MNRGSFLKSLSGGLAAIAAFPLMASGGSPGDYHRRINRDSLGRELTPPDAGGSIIYVSTDHGKDSNNGAFLTPFATIATGIAAVTEGRKSVVVMPGTYNLPSPPHNQIKEGESITARDCVFNPPSSNLGGLLIGGDGKRGKESQSFVLCGNK